MSSNLSNIPKSYTPVNRDSSVRGSLPSGYRYFPDPLREENARFIEWAINCKGLDSWFVNQTFKDYEHPDSADRKYRLWIRDLNRALFHKGGSQLRWVRADEWQIREVIHFHSIVQGSDLDLLSRKRWEDRWESLSFNTGFARIYNADRRAAPYLAKYTSKSRGGELHLGGYWRGYRGPNSLSVVRHTNQ